MSEAPAQAAPPAARRTSGGGGSNAFTRQVGPLPLWGWMGLLLAVAVIYSQWHKNKAAAATNQNTAGQTQASSQTPPFIIQNYTTYPGQGPAGPAGPAGPPGASGTGSTTGPGGPINQGGTATNPLPRPTPTPPATPTTNPPPQGNKPAQPVEYRVKPGDTLTSIAAKYHVSGGANALYQYNIGTGPGTANRDPATIKTLKDRGENLIFPNELIYIPT